jgi:hypothetical protein
MSDIRALDLPYMKQTHIRSTTRPQRSVCSIVFQYDQPKQLASEVTAISASVAHGPVRPSTCAAHGGDLQHRYLLGRDAVYFVILVPNCCEMLITFHQTTRRHILKDE